MEQAKEIPFVFSSKKTARMTNISPLNAERTRLDQDSTIWSIQLKMIKWWNNYGNNIKSFAGSIDLNNI